MKRAVQQISPLVTTKWLSGKVSPKQRPSAQMRLLDGSLFDELDGKEEFKKRHIPRAQYFDINECRDHNSPYPRMVPNPRDFEDYVGALGINNKTHVVVYDSHLVEGYLSAARVWWMMRYFGHDLVSVLNGGLARWIKDGYEVTTDVDKVSPEVFKAQPRKELLRVFEDIEKVSEDQCKTIPIADARGPKKFKNRILGSTNIPHRILHLDDTSDKPEFKSPNEIKKIYQENGMDVEKPFIAACNTGVTACTLAFGAYLCGNETVPIYDGSWQEWNKRADQTLVVREEFMEE